MDKDRKLKKIPFFKRKYLINKDFQIPFAARLLIVNMSVISVSYALNYYLLFRFNYLAEEMGLPVDHYFYSFIRNELAHMSYIFLIFFFISVVVLATYSLFLSHRIVGPLENIKICFKNIEDKIKAGTISDFKATSFREDDFFKEFAKAYNQHLDLITSKLKLQEHSNKIDENDHSSNISQIHNGKTHELTSLNDNLDSNDQGQDQNHKDKKKAA